MNLSEFLRTLKLSYVAGNLLNYPRLAANRRAYQRFGLKRPVWLPVSSADMPKPTAPGPWIDQPGGPAQIEAHPDFSTFSPEIQMALKAWPEKGYLILKGFLDPEKVAALNVEVDRLLEEGRVKMRERARRVMFAYRKSELLRQVVSDPELLRVLDFILGKPVAPFQSINFVQGSEQRAHSDSIHMTTYPLGYMIASWIALENITPDNGPLFYYPGSHRLPYLLNPDFDHGGSRFRIGDEANRRFEDAIEREIQAEKLKKEYFYAEPGDMLIWHANLIHGGDKINDPESTRKSMVMHYFANDVICYHELTQRAALLEDGRELAN